MFLFSFPLPSVFLARLSLLLKRWPKIIMEAALGQIFRKQCTRREMFHFHGDEWLVWVQRTPCSCHSSFLFPICVVNVCYIIQVTKCGTILCWVLCSVGFLPLVRCCATQFLSLLTDAKQLVMDSPNLSVFLRPRNQMKKITSLLLLLLAYTSCAQTCLFSPFLCEEPPLPLQITINPHRQLEWLVSFLFSACHERCWSDWRWAVICSEHGGRYPSPWQHCVCGARQLCPASRSGV